MVFTVTGTFPVYIRIGLAGISATPADYICLPDSQLTIGKDQDHDTVSVVSPAGASQIHILQGEGV